MKKLKYIISALLLAAATLLFYALFLNNNPGDTRSSAEKVGKIVERRFSLLQNYGNKVLIENGNDDALYSILPEDMVIYRYVNDTLQYWVHSFPVINDDISDKTVFQIISNPRTPLHSPLADIADSVQFRNFGSKWFLVKSVEENGVKVVEGLEVVNENDFKSFNGVNPRLRLSEHFSIKPLSNSGGSAVFLGGVPIFKVFCDSLRGTTLMDGGYVGLVVLCLLAAGLLFLLSGRTVKRYLVFFASMLLTMACVYVWGRTAQNDLKIFSPVLYADGNLFYSLGAVFILDLSIILTVLGLYLVRKDIGDRLHTKKSLVVSVALSFAGILGVLMYVHETLKSIIVNSGISLELYRLEEMDLYTALVYVSFILVLLCTLLLMKMMQMSISRLSGKRFDLLSRRNRVVFSALAAMYMVITAAVLGFRKEQNRLDVWADRLAVERDISLEMQLLMAEKGISSDQIIASLAVLPNTENTILNRILDVYLQGISQDYDLSVRLPNGENNLYRGLYAGRVRNSDPIAEGSQILFSSGNNGMSRYTGVFFFYSSEYGTNCVMLCVDPRETQVDRGYSSIIGITPPGRVSVPMQYAYAKYKDGKLTRFRGNFAYPTTMDDSVMSAVEGSRHFSMDGYTHFVTNITDGETIIMSRPHMNVLNYLIAMLFTALVTFIFSSLLSVKNGGIKWSERSYYKTRIKGVLMSALFLTLASMVAVSVWFVFKRNEDNKNKVMSDKINSVQALVQDAVKGARNSKDISNMDFYEAIDLVSSNTGSDISIFDSRGMIMMSTARELYERMIMDGRIDGRAYSGILRSNKRYYIQKESVNDISFYNMYAPIMGVGGNIIAILCVPYAEMSYNFEKDAAMHLVAIIVMFFVLLLLANFMITTIVNRMFKPLSEMGRKMSGTSIGSLDYISYNNRDEVSNLVESYNRMVTELSESTRKLAQAERDKAWSGMARQVAHEIKNPLTPMKLQIQRLIRLKEKGDENWGDKFNEATKVILDHIDVLTDTANEFSDFAKLYSEEPVEINLDKLLQEEISMFDNRDNISFEYMGLMDAVVKGPKPQLTRVFVNLLGNAVQALEDKEEGRIVVSLRNSTDADYYDIVFEDNGNGVDQENVEKLFTPNFTTKTSGSGLGLAISKSILEKCGAHISYSRSFSIGGACFTIRYPKRQFQVF